MEIQTTKIYSELQQAVTDGVRVVSLQGSSRSGKTYNTVLYFISTLLTTPALSVSIVRKTLPAIRGSVYRDFVDILVKMNLYDPQKMNRTEMVYTFPNGSFVEFFSTDNEQKLRGRKRDILFVNEANELDFIEWQQLIMRTKLYAVVDYNPSFSEDHWLNALNAERTTRHIITTYKDNPFLDPRIVAEIERLKDRNESLWKIYGLGERAEVEGVIYHFRTIERLPDKSGGMIETYGMDFGFTNDPSVCVHCLIDTGRKNIYLDQVFYRTGMLNADIARELKRANVGNVPIYCDSAEPKSIAELAQMGYNTKPCYKATKITEQIAHLQQYAIFVTARSIEGCKELRQYCWEQDRQGRPLNVPMNGGDHFADAFRYGCFTPLSSFRQTGRYFFI